jgi:hypothetical protein
MKWPGALLILALVACKAPITFQKDGTWAIGVLADGRVEVRPAGLLHPLPDGGFLLGDDTRIERYRADGRKDTSFRLAWKPGGSIRGIAVRPGGTILIGGKFEGGLQQFLPDGRPDPAFHFPDIPVLGFALRSDGRIVVVSSGLPRLAGYLPDGTRERSWRGAVELDGYTLTPSWATGLPGDRVFLAGDGWIAILRPDALAAAPVQTPKCDPPLVAPMADGRVVVGCGRKLLRFSADGTPDASFHPPEMEMLGIAAKGDEILVVDSTGYVTTVK